MGVNALVSSIAIACTACGPLGVLSRPQSVAAYGSGEPPADKVEKYCADIRNDSSYRAQADLYAGYGFALLGAATAGAATVMIAADKVPSDNARGAEAAAPIVSALFFIVMKGFFSREDAATELAKQASLALTAKATSDQMNKCTTALAAWDGARSDAASIASTLQTKDQTDKEKAESDKKKAQDESATQKQKIEDQVKQLYDQATPDLKKRLLNLFPTTLQQPPTPPTATTTPPTP